MYHGLIFSYRKERVERGNGAHRIGTFLRAHGWDIEVIDFCTDWLQEELEEFVKSRVTSNTKFFGFSSFINWWPEKTNDFTAWLKKTYPDIVTIIGGQGCLLTPAENIDYWIDSFGEFAILELLKYITGNTIFHSGLHVEKYKNKNVIKALHNFPAWKMPSYRIIYEPRDFLQPHEMLTIETSRGCKFKCDFCNFPILGVKEDVSRSAEDLKEELVINYDQYGIKNYTIADETFNDRKEKILKYADMVQQLHFNPWFMAFMRGDLLINQRPYWDDIAALGVGGHFYGIETFNHESGKIIGKGMNPDKLKQGLLDIKSFFEPKGIYRGTISLICGLPKETPETFWNGINWCVEHWKNQSVTSWYLELLDDTTQLSNHSEFTKNLEKYGLRRTQTKTKPEGRSFFPGVKNVSMWEHDDMNELQAMEIMKIFYADIFPLNFSSSGFSCPTGLLENQTNDIRKVLIYKNFNDNSPHIHKHINDYKKKKLS